MVTSTTSGITASKKAGHAGTQFEHRDHDEAQHEQVAQDHQKTGGKQFVQRIDIGGDASDQAADRVVIEEGKIQAL